MPADAFAAGAAPGAKELAATIRAADPCVPLDRVFPKRFGPVVKTVVGQAQSFTECRLTAGTTETAPKVRFSVDLDAPLAADTRAKLLSEQLGSRTVFHEASDPESNNCAYYVPYGDSGWGAEIQLTKFIEDRGSNQAAWPEACSTTREYTAAIADRIVALTPRTSLPPSPSLVGRDPCDDAMIAATKQRMPGFTAVGVVYRPYNCRVRFTYSGMGVDVQLDFDHDAEQAYGKPAVVAGHRGQLFDGSGCTVSVVYRPETSSTAWDAHNVEVGTQTSSLKDVTRDYLSYADIPGACTTVQALAALQISRLR